MGGYGGAEICRHIETTQYFLYQLRNINIVCRTVLRPYCTKPVVKYSKQSLWNLQVFSFWSKIKMNFSFSGCNPKSWISQISKVSFKFKLASAPTTKPHVSQASILWNGKKKKCLWFLRGYIVIKIIGADLKKKEILNFSHRYVPKFVYKKRRKIVWRYNERMSMSIKGAKLTRLSANIEKVVTDNGKTTLFWSWRLSKEVDFYGYYNTLYILHKYE